MPHLGVLLWAILGRSILVCLLAIRPFDQRLVTSFQNLYDNFILHMLNDFMDMEIQLQEDIQKLGREYRGTYVFLHLQENDYDISKYVGTRQSYLHAAISYGKLIAIGALILIAIIVSAGSYSDPFIRIPLAFTVLFLAGITFCLIGEFRAIYKLSKILKIHTL